MRTATLALQPLQALLRSPLVASLTFPHDVDHYLSALNPRWAVNRIRAVVTDVRHQTHDTVTLTLRPNARWEGFLPGQFVQLSVEIDGVTRTRCYSPAQSAHRRDRIELTIKAHSWGYVSQHLKRHAHAGMIVDLSPAMGTFALPAQRPERTLLISGGSGITPVMAMLRTLLDEGHTQPITFMHFARNASEQIYARELEALDTAHANLQLIRIYAESDEGTARGLYSAELLQRLVPDFVEATTFLCGPPGLMQAVAATWESHAISARLHQEQFTAVTAAPTDLDSVSGDVRFARAERYVPNDGRSLLDQAEAAGLRPQSGCRMGICATCTCRKTSGTVRNLLTGSVSSQPDEDIRICISAPVGDVTLDL